MGNTNGASSGPRKPPCKLVGENGNALNVVGRVARALREDGQEDRAVEFIERATRSRSYDAVLALCFEYVEPR